MRQHNSPKNQTELNLQEPHFCDLETNKSNSEYLEPAFRRQKTDELRVQRTEDGRQRTETGELLHHGFGMQFTFRRQKRDGLASLVLDRGQKETEELLHHGFGIQLTET